MEQWPGRRPNQHIEDPQKGHVLAAHASNCCGHECCLSNKSIFPESDEDPAKMAPDTPVPARNHLGGNLPLREGGIISFSGGVIAGGQHQPSRRQSFRLDDKEIRAAAPAAFRMTGFGAPPGPPQDRKSRDTLRRDRGRSLPVDGSRWSRKCVCNPGEAPGPGRVSSGGVARAEQAAREARFR